MMKWTEDMRKCLETLKELTENQPEVVARNTSVSVMTHVLTKRFLPRFNKLLGEAELNLRFTEEGEGDGTD